MRIVVLGELGNSLSHRTVLEAFVHVVCLDNAEVRTFATNKVKRRVSSCTLAGQRVLTTA